MLSPPIASGTESERNAKQSIQALHGGSHEGYKALACQCSSSPHHVAHPRPPAVQLSLVATEELNSTSTSSPSVPGPAAATNHSGQCEHVRTHGQHRDGKKR